MTFLSLMLVLTFVLIGPTSHSDRERIPFFDWALALLAAVTGVYFVSQADVIAQRITLLDPLSTYDILFASLILALTIEVMRRTVGVGLTLIVLIFLVYNLFGDRLGGVLGHGLITYEHFLDITIFTTDGLFGVPLRVAATYAFLFVLFGTTLSYAGGSVFFFNIAAYLTGRSPGGPAKIAVISSGLYGTISGSPTSDVVTTGAITIPMMKKMGYRATFAGAVEVAASTGGSLLPPVMGAAAFIMSEYTGIDYVDNAFAALIPALIYYIPSYLQVHLRDKQNNLAGVDRSEIPSLKVTMRDGGLFIIPLIAITWALVEGYTPTYAAVYGVAAVLVVSMVRSNTRLSRAKIYEILAETSVRTVPVAGACAAAGANIADAQVFTTTDGRALDTIMINREFDVDSDELRRGERIGKVIEDVLTGRKYLPEIIATKKTRKRRTRPFRVTPKVSISNTLSDHFTVIEIEGLDRVGLLSEVTAVLSDLSLDIGSAHITTFGEKVIDTFYVRDLVGHKITNENKQANITARLRAAVAGIEDDMREKMPAGIIAPPAPVMRRGGQS